MKHLIIIGARGFGREVYNWTMDCIKAGLDLQIKGFLDDKTDALDGFDNYPRILSSVEDYEVQQDDVFLCALGDVSYRRHYTELIVEKGGRFITIIHPTASMSQNVKIGEGCIIGRYVAVSCDITIGNYVSISAQSVIGHDVVIGDYCNVGAICILAGGVELEESVTLYPHTNVIPHKKVGKGATIGAGSVVLRNVKEGTTVFGNPAKKIN